MQSIRENLNRLRLGRNDRIVLVLPNGPDMASAFLGVAACATAAPLNPGYRAEEFDFYLTDLKASALIVQALLGSPAIAVARRLGIAVLELCPQPQAGRFTLRGAAPGNARADTTSPLPGDIALLLHTSGTTSRPKLVPLTHANIFASAAHVAQTLGLSEADRCLNVMPLFHIHGLIAALLASIRAGGSIVCPPQFGAESFFARLNEFKPTWYTAVPTMHQSVLAHCRENRDIVARHSLRFIRSSSAALPPAVMAALESVFKVPVIEAYGMTEAAHQIASNPLPPGPRKLRSVGLAAGPEIAIMDAAGNLLDAGQTGEVAIRGANVSAGYENNAEANRASYANGWFRTGDQGYLDAAGYLFLTGRLKEIINRGGEKISPREIDETLLEHPAIAQAVAFALPHPTLGEDVAAAVVLKAGAQESEAAIRAFLLKRIADFKVPSRVVIVDAIPKGPTGKLQRIGLADKLADQLKNQRVAPRNETERIVAGIFAEVLKTDVGVNDNFFALGGDSLRATRLITEIEKAFGRRLSFATVFQAPTTAELARTLGGASPLDDWISLVPINPTGDTSPLFFVHISPGVDLRILGKHLGVGQRFYGLNPQGLDLRYPPLRRTEEMAAPNLREIRQVQPHGPYYLIGECAVAMVAFEMAQQLRAEGEDVALLAMLDPVGAGPGVTSRKSWGDHARRLRALLSIPKVLAYVFSPRVADVMPISLKRHVLKLCLTRRISIPRDVFWRYLQSVLIQARPKYVPRLYPGKMQLIWTCDRLPPRRPAKRSSWNQFAGASVEHYELPISHNWMLHEPEVRSLAAQLRILIDKATGNVGQANPARYEQA